MKSLAFTTSFFLISACSTPPVRSTVDSYGELPLDKSRTYFFDAKNLTLLEKQAVQDCKVAALETGLKISEASCKECIPVELHTKIAGTEQVIRSSPGFGSSWGVFGGGPGLGVGLGTGSTVSSTRETGREMDLLFFDDSSEQKRAREIQVRSVGRENSVTAVAYEMCKAAFTDYPQNIKGKVYEVDVKKQK